MGTCQMLKAGSVGEEMDDNDVCTLFKERFGSAIFQYKGEIYRRESFSGSTHLMPSLVENTPENDRYLLSIKHEHEYWFVDYEVSDHETDEGKDQEKVWIYV